MRKKVEWEMQIFVTWKNQILSPSTPWRLDGKRRLVMKWSNIFTFILLLQNCLIQTFPYMTKHAVSSHAFGTKDPPTLQRPRAWKRNWPNDSPNSYRSNPITSLLPVLHFIFPSEMPSPSSHARCPTLTFSWWETERIPVIRDTALDKRAGCRERDKKEKRYWQSLC